MASGDFVSVDHRENIKQSGGYDKFRAVFRRVARLLGWRVAEPNSDEIEEPGCEVAQEPAVLDEPRQNIAGRAGLKHRAARQQADRERCQHGDEYNGGAAGALQQKMACARDEPSQDNCEKR